jgi:hypothetical protein
MWYWHHSLRHLNLMSVHDHQFGGAQAVWHQLVLVTANRQLPRAAAILVTTMQQLTLPTVV